MKTLDPNAQYSYTLFVYTEEDTIEMSVEETIAHWEKLVFKPLQKIAKELGPDVITVDKMMTSGGLAVITATQDAAKTLQSKGFFVYPNGAKRKV